MPRINFANVTESTGERVTLEPGGYVLTIIGVEVVPGNDFIKFKCDVAEGEHAGIYKDATKPLTYRLQWREEWMRSKTKRVLKVLAEANPTRLHVLVDPTTHEFATVAEFDSDDWDAFVGCVFGAVVRKYVFTGDDGTDIEGIEIGAFKSPQDIRDGNWSPMARRDSRKSHHDQSVPPQARAAQAKAAMADDDIPF